MIDLEDLLALIQGSAQSDGTIEARPAAEAVYAALQAEESALAADAYWLDQFRG